MKSRVSEIRVKRIRVNQGVGVLSKNSVGARHPALALLLTQALLMSFTIFSNSSRLGGTCLIHVRFFNHGVKFTLLRTA